MALAASRKYLDDLATTGPDPETAALYERAIAALGEAIEAIGQDDIEARCSAVWKATEAVTTLYLNLDIENGGDMTDDLAALYGRVLSHLINVNLYNDSTMAQAAIDLLESLCEPWSASNGTISACLFSPMSPRAGTTDGSGTAHAASASERSTGAGSPN